MEIKHTNNFFLNKQQKKNNNTILVLTEMTYVSDTKVFLFVLSRKLRISFCMHYILTTSGNFINTQT